VLRIAGRGVDSRARDADAEESVATSFDPALRLGFRRRFGVVRSSAGVGARRREEREVREEQVGLDDHDSWSPRLPAHPRHEALFEVPRNGPPPGGPGGDGVSLTKATVAQAYASRQVGELARSPVSVVWAQSAMRAQRQSRPRTRGRRRAGATADVVESPFMSDARSVNQWHGEGLGDDGEILHEDLLPAGPASPSRSRPWSAEDRGHEVGESHASPGPRLYEERGGSRSRASSRHRTISRGPSRCSQPGSDCESGDPGRGDITSRITGPDHRTMPLCSQLIVNALTRGYTRELSQSTFTQHERIHRRSRQASSRSSDRSSTSVPGRSCRRSSTLRSPSRSRKHKENLTIGGTAPWERATVRSDRDGYDRRPGSRDAGRDTGAAIMMPSGQSVWPPPNVIATPVDDGPRVEGRAGRLATGPPPTFVSSPRR